MRLGCMERSNKRGGTQESTGQIGGDRDFELMCIPPSLSGMSSYMMGPLNTAIQEK